MRAFTQKITGEKQETVALLSWANPLGVSYTVSCCPPVEELTDMDCDSSEGHCGEGLVTRCGEMRERSK